MKTYHMHIIWSADDQCTITTDSTDDDFIHAWRVFSSCCEQLIYGFGDSRSSEMYNLLETMNTKAEMVIKYNGEVIIKLEVME